MCTITYEKFNEDLEEVLENAARKEYEENISTHGEDVENNNFGVFDPDRDENLKQYDFGPDLGIGSKKKKLKKDHIIQNLTVQASMNIEALCKC